MITEANKFLIMKNFIQMKIQVLLLHISSMGGEESQKFSLKPPQDIYKAYLKSMAHSDQYFPRFFYLHKETVH